MQHLYFIRHGESEFNKANLWAGSSDPPLTAAGHEQAKRAGQLAKRQGLTFDVIVSSPLKRAYETAKYIAPEVGFPKDQIILYDKLKERHFGKLEGTRNLAASAEYLLGESNIDHHDGVERMEAFQQRVDKVLIYLQTLPQANVLVVAHGAVGRALWRAINHKLLTDRGKKLNNAQLVKFI